ncbi:hypothetical protein M8818_002386 [Zalaria obscura]|uniref:Uncharacterized protein n=1 Tax=Zalaria obscura TaxID=2024903 RepID=A0ACC3SJM8_9PEZI
MQQEEDTQAEWFAYRMSSRMSSQPLVYFPAVPRPDQIIGAFKQLSKRKKTAYLNLTAPCKAPTAAPAKEDYEAYIRRVWESNAIDPFTPEADWTNSRAPLGSDARAIYPVSARLNHSCTPNCVRSFDTSDPPKARLHVVRNIAAGEELTIAYAHVHSVTCTDQSTTLCGGFNNPEWGVDVCTGWSVRRQAIRDLGFECDCKACNRSDKLFRLYNARRERIAELFERLNDRSITPSMANIDALIEDHLSCANELVAWLEEEGLVGVELARAYAHARAYETMHSPSKRYRATEVQWKYLDIIQACYGKDSAAYKQAELLMAILRRRP